MWPEISQHCVEKQWLSPLGTWLCGTQIRTEPRIKGRRSSLRDRIGCWVSRPGPQSQEWDINSSCTCWKVFWNSSGRSNKQATDLNLKKLITSQAAYQYKGVHDLCITLSKTDFLFCSFFLLWLWLMLAFSDTELLEKLKYYVVRSPHCGCGFCNHKAAISKAVSSP